MDSCRSDTGSADRNLGGMVLRKYMYATAVAFAGSLLLGLGAGSPASAGPAESADPGTQATCPDTLEPTVPGGEAKWTLACNNAGTKVKVSGWVEDTRADGKCAYVQFTPKGNGKGTWKACGAGERTDYSFTAKGDEVEGLLTTR